MVSFKFQTLCTKEISRIILRISGECFVKLSSGKILEFKEGKCEEFIEGDMSKQEMSEYAKILTFLED